MKEEKKLLTIIAQHDFSETEIAGCTGKTNRRAVNADLVKHHHNFTKH